jgi:putative addiction module component (TIGR02574 family)
MEPEKIASEIKKLSISQRLILAQDIWDTIALESGKLPMPEWQKKALEKRYAEYQQGGLEIHDWEQLHEDLKNRYK